MCLNVEEEVTTNWWQKFFEFGNPWEMLFWGWLPEKIAQNAQF